MKARILLVLRRHSAAVVMDALVVVTSFLLALSLRSVNAPLRLDRVILFCVPAVGVYLFANYLLGLYHHIWRYASADDATVLATSVAGSTVLLTLLDLMWPGRGRLPISVVWMMSLFAFIGFAVARYQGRLWGVLRLRWRNLRGDFAQPRTRVLIVGAGDAGELLARSLANHSGGEVYEVVGFVDDDLTKLGMRVHDYRVLGDRYALPSIVRDELIDLVVIAIYNMGAETLHDLLTICETTSARIKVLPNVIEFMQSTQGGPVLRDVGMSDLLGRKPVQVDRDACRVALAGKRVLVTGAAGSIGSELCRQVVSFGPELLLAVDNNETGLYDLSAELQSLADAPTMRFVVADVCREARMRGILEQYRPQIVFHAAAYKHVPLMEEHPQEAVRVNVLGTWVVARLTCDRNAERFVFVSTDKAVEPTSVMGATKRLGEIITSCLACDSLTLCTTVRFGNVLGSRGSVVPTFERQIDAGGPVTITHPEMTRYFMSISEAVSLVIQAATLTEGNDAFVLDMGEQLKVETLAMQLIRLRGLRPGIDVPIQYIGPRPGERMREQLVGEGEERQPTSHPAISRIRPNSGLDRFALRSAIEQLAALVDDPGSQQVTLKLWEILGTQGPAA